MKKLSPAESSALVALARSLGVSPRIIYQMIQFESSWNPLVKNPSKDSSARGLFQWINSTAREYGFSSSLDLIQKNPTILSQLEFAKRYFQKMAPFKSDYDFVMSNFQPAHRNKSPNTRILDLPNGAEKQRMNPSIKVLNDYYLLIAKQKVPADIANSPAGIVPAVIIAGALFFSLIACTIEQTKSIIVKPLKKSADQ